MSFIVRLCRALTAHRVRYAIVGGHAVALHGAVRGTVDIDIVINWDRRSLRGAEAALASLGLESRLPVTADDVVCFRDEYIRNRNLIGWNFVNPHNPAETVDIVISYDLKGKRRQAIRTIDGPVHVLSRDDLLAMKRASGRPQDLEDVAALERLP